MTDESDLTEKQQQVKERFIEDREFWTELLDDLLRLDPEFLDIYRRFSSHPWKEGSLDPVIREMLYVAIDCSTTHLYNPGTRVHIRNSLERGASVEEVLEVILLSSSIGMNTVEVGVPILLAESGDVDLDEIDADSAWREAEKLDPEYVEIAEDYRNHSLDGGALDPKDKEFVMIAVTAAATHLYHDGVQRHVKRALEHGATREEIMEVLEVASVTGIHTVTESVPILVEEAEKLDKLPDDS